MWLPIGKYYKKKNSYKKKRFCGVWNTSQPGLRAFQMLSKLFSKLCKPFANLSQALARCFKLFSNPLQMLRKPFAKHFKFFTNPFQMLRKPFLKCILAFCKCFSNPLQTLLKPVANLFQILWRAGGTSAQGITRAKQWLMFNT